MGFIKKDADRSQIEAARIAVGPTEETGSDKADRSGSPELRVYKQEYVADRTSAKKQEQEKAATGTTNTASTTPAQGTTQTDKKP